jgi:4-hydroxy-3-polyprenylbenzoate decarboxylase
MNSQETIQLLKKHNLLKIIDTSLDIYLEIPHVAYLEAKKSEPKALLFTNPVNGKKGIKFNVPVLMNIFCSEKAVELLIGDVNAIASEIENLLHIKPPDKFIDKILMFKQLFSLKSVFPKRLKRKGECQEVVKIGKEANLEELPVLTTWDKDAAPFITMGQVYTRSVDGKNNNLGMYRLQVHDSGTLGMHWQIHKDANNFFHEYKKAGVKMPVSVAIGGDPLYIWCGQAPLPAGIFELMLYGFIRGESPKLVKSLTNDIYVPYNADYVIEGFVDTERLKEEGPFGDHTGYYTEKEFYPFMEITAITCKKNPVFSATVVGKPPLEDKYMGFATERIFLPLLRTTVPDLIDYHMPENGVFHNLIIAKLKTRYPGHAQQVMHAFWGVGQMSFVKHVIFVGETAPELTDYYEITKHILNRISRKNIFISTGVVDALDHSSDSYGVGGKLCVDCTGAPSSLKNIERINDEELLLKFKKLSNDATEVRQFFPDTENPVTVVKINKNTTVKAFLHKTKTLFKHIKIVICLDDKNNYLDNPYMLIWRAVNNFDAARDFFIIDGTVCLDATSKGESDNFKRKWPDEVKCNRDVLKKLKDMNVIDIDEHFIKKFLI